MLELLAGVAFVVLVSMAVLLLICGGKVQRWRRRLTY